MAQDGYVTAELVKNAFLGKIARERTLIEFFKQHNEQYLQKVKMNTTDKTYSRYELTKKRLMEFMKFKYSVSDMLIKDINVVFIEDFLLYIKLNSSSKCNGIHINNLFKFFVWCEVSKSFTRSII